MLCQFTTTDKPNLYRCEQCGREVRTSHTPDRIHAKCKQEQHWQLGSWLAKQFKRIGVKQKPGCGCKKREQKLNRAWNRAYGLLSSFFKILRLFR